MHKRKLLNLNKTIVQISVHAEYVSFKIQNVQDKQTLR